MNTFQPYIIITTYSCKYLYIQQLYIPSLKKCNIKYIIVMYLYSILNMACTDW